MRILNFFRFWSAQRVSLLHPKNFKLKPTQSTMKATSSKRLIHALKNSTILVSQRIIALDQLKTVDDAEALLAIADAGLAPIPELAEKARQVIFQFSYEQFSGLVDILLSGSNAASGHRIFNLLYQLKPRNLLKYLIEFSANVLQEDPKRKTIVNWMKGLHITDDYIKMMLNLPASRDSNPGSAALALGRVLQGIDGSTATNIAKQIKGASTNVSLKGLGILEQIADGTDLSQLLMGMFQEANDPNVRYKASKTMVKLSKGLRMVKTALKAKDARIRADALESMWVLEDAEFQGEAQALASLYLTDLNNRVRVNAARVLHELGDPRGLKTLIALLEDPNAAMRASAVWMLGEIRESSAVPKLCELADTDPSKSVVDNIKLALEKMDLLAVKIEGHLASLHEFTHSDPESHLPYDPDYIDILQLLRDRGISELVEMAEEIQEAAPDVCAKILNRLEGCPDEESTLTFLIAACYCTDNFVQSKAALVISRLCDSKKIIQHFLANSDFRVQANTVEVLEQHSEPFVTEILVEMLKSPNNRVLVNAAKALCKKGDPRGLRTLLINLRHPDPAFRASCVWALGEVGNADIEGQLELLKQDANENVRQNVQIALEKIKASNQGVSGIISAKIHHVNVHRAPNVDCYVSVISGDGHPIVDLTAENFLIKENDIPRRDFQLSPEKDWCEDMQA
ncbi:HEAT repeat domain-containing protein, partial [Candidatus Poribacteria bacterium]|nr:HEAT repeat domain-containing protein [Candidatus Poribacteria bacterium]